MENTDKKEVVISPAPESMIVPGGVSLIYSNSFQINQTPTDIQFLLGVNNQANIAVAMTFVSAKNFAKGLNQAISDIERKLGSSIDDFETISSKLMQK